MGQVSVEIIQACLNRCLHCSSGSCLDRDAFIPSDVVFGVIDDMPVINMDTLCLSGGEPFLHKDLLDIVEYAKNHGLKIYIYTSGVVLDSYVSSDPCGLVCSIGNDILSKLKHIGVDKLIFNLPAADPGLYAKFTDTTGYFNVVLQSIKNCVSHDIFTELHFVPTKLNINQIDNVLLLAKNIGVNRVSFLGFVPHGRGKTNAARLLLSDYEYRLLKEKLDGFSLDFVRVGMPLQISGCDQCHACSQKLCIRYDGSVFGCETFKHINLYDYLGHVILPDSVFDRRLCDIHKDSKHLDAERVFVKGWMSVLNCDEKCPVQRMFRREVRDKLL